MSYTRDDLNRLKKAYARGVLSVREGDTQVTYQSAEQMRKAIDTIEAELGINKPSRPRGSRRVRFHRA